MPAGIDSGGICHALAEHEQFGSFERIQRRTREVLDFILEILADQAGDQRAADSIAAGVTRVRDETLLFDPVVRDALENGLRELKSGELRPDSSVFDVLTRIGERNGLGTLSESPLPVLKLTDTSDGVQLWNPAVVDSAATARFRELCADQLQHREGIEADTVTGTTRDTELLLAAGETAHRLLGPLAADLFAHVRVLVLVAGRTVFRSASDRGAPGAVFLRLAPKDDPLTVAELLVHESVHHRLYDLYASRTILAVGYQERTAQPVLAHWNQPSAFDTNLWSPDRALAAFHVYVHLALLYVRACEAGLNVPVGVAPRAQQCCERARYLGEQLQERSGDLGPDGIQMVGWLLTQLASIEAALSASTAAA